MNLTENIVLLDIWKHEIKNATYPAPLVVDLGHVHPRGLMSISRSGSTLPAQTEGQRQGGWGQGWLPVVLTPPNKGGRMNESQGMVKNPLQNRMGSDIRNATTLTNTKWFVDCNMLTFEYSRVNWWVSRSW